MKIDDIQFHRLETLSRLSVSPEERIRIKRDIERILDYMERLDEVDVTDIEPMVRPIDLENQTREDVIKTGSLPGDILENAYDLQNGFIAVPKIR